MNFSFKYFHLLVAFLLFWCFESTIEAKQLIQCDLKSGQCIGKNAYIIQQLNYLTNKINKDPLGVFDNFWPKHNRTTTLKPNTTTVLQTKSTTYPSNSTTEHWNTTTAAPQSTLYSNMTTEQWKTTTAVPQSTSYHSNMTTEQWNTTRYCFSSINIVPIIRMQLVTQLIVIIYFEEKRQNTIIMNEGDLTTIL